jgi:hypothetical protein
MHTCADREFGNSLKRARLELGEKLELFYNSFRIAVNGGPSAAKAGEFAVRIRRGFSFSRAVSKPSCEKACCLLAE